MKEIYIRPIAKVNGNRCDRGCVLFQSTDSNYPRCKIFDQMLFHDRNDEGRDKFYWEQAPILRCEECLQREKAE